MTPENAAANLNRSPEKKADDDDEDDDSPVLLRRAARLAKSRSGREGRPEGGEDKDSGKPEDARSIFKKPPAEVKTASKEEVPQEDEVSPGEKPLAAKALAEEEAQAIPEPAAEAEITQAVAADIAAKEFLEKVAETGDIEASAEETLTEIAATPAELAEVMQTGPDHAESATEPLTPDSVEEIVFDRAAEAGPEDSEPDTELDDETVGAPAEQGPAPGGAPPPPEVGDPGQPPHGGNRGPAPPFASGGTPPGGGPIPIPTLSGNIYHSPLTPDSPLVERYDQGNPAVTALIGGIIGYMIGRRRGRIKTEKRLLPIQKKLERQVEDLHWQIKSKEQAIRKVAARKVQNNALVIEKVASSRAAKLRPEKALSMPQTAERRVAPEASQLHGAAKAHEHLGHMLVTAEAAGVRRERAAEKAPTKLETKAYEQLPEHLRQRHVETLNRTELLALSEKIILDGASLRHIYETHLIGERGLRRLVAEYLRGGDVKKILRREIIEHEIDFERDPVLRDLPGTAVPTAAPARSTNQTLDKLVEQASAGLGANSDALAYYKARAAYEAQEHEQQTNQRRLADISFGIAIAVLVIAIVLLFVLRG